MPEPDDDEPDEDELEDECPDPEYQRMAQRNPLDATGRDWT
jgi:hypothetical protein